MSVVALDEASEPFFEIALELVIFLEYYCPYSGSEDYHWRPFPQSRGVDEISYSQRMAKILELAVAFEKVCYFMFLNGYYMKEEVIFDAFSSDDEESEFALRESPETKVKEILELGKLWGQYTSLYGQAYPEDLNRQTVNEEGVPLQGLMINELKAKKKKKDFQTAGAVAQSVKGENSNKAIKSFLQNHYPHGLDGRSNKAVAGVLFKEAQKCAVLLQKNKDSKLDDNEHVEFERVSYLEGLVASKGDIYHPYAFSTIRVRLSQYLKK